METNPIIATGDNVNGQSVVIAESIPLTFDQLKDDILKRAKSKDACMEGYMAAKKASTFEELLEVIKANIQWCLRSQMFDASYLETHFEKALLHQKNIYTSGHYDLSIENTVVLHFIGSASATVKAWGSASATVEACDSASATVEACDSASATVKAWGSASATVKACDSASATVKACDSASATVEAWGSASATVEAWGSASATVEAWGSASATVEAWGSASATVEACDSASATFIHHN